MDSRKEVPIETPPELQYEGKAEMP